MEVTGVLQQSPTLTVKLSDFGASRYIPVDQSGLDTVVQGHWDTWTLCTIAQGT
jgi:hypothetical protein